MVRTASQKRLSPLRSNRWLTSLRNLRGTCGTMPMTYWASASVSTASGEPSTKRTVRSSTSSTDSSVASLLDPLLGSSGFMIRSKVKRTSAEVSGLPAARLSLEALDKLSLRNRLAEIGRIRLSEDEVAAAG
mgnify:CR=1 FL=1